MNILDDIKMQYKAGGIAQRLIYWNVGCFIAAIILFYDFQSQNFLYPSWIALSSDVSTFLMFPWTFLSYSFFHDGFFHLFFNMIILNFASQLFLTFFTQKQLLGVYILSAIFAGLVFVLSYFIMGYDALIVGASAAIMAILVAVTAYQPLMNIRMFLVGNVKLWHITGVIILLDLLQFRGGNTGGHISHLAGALFGYLYIVLLKNGMDLTVGVSKAIDFFTNQFRKSPSTPFKKVHKNYKAPKEAKTTSKIITKDRNQQQIDAILDKISQSGYDSLSKDEKEFLFKTGK
ncbi:rhomboid family intramembrane serine protease [Flavobacterium frigidarium]|uniref:Rhomboid family intramembrane serine protease n=1 Tax=Flavobacterium frigidarium TaxID=99286 RepID=A0ABV4KBS7_9FLAO